MSFLSYFGRLCFGMVVAYTLISTVVVCALVSCGHPPPEALVANPLSQSLIDGLVDQVNSAGGAVLLSSAIPYLGMVILLNLVGGFFIGLGKAGVALAKLLPPALGSLCVLVFSAIHAFGLLYVFMRLLGREL